MFLTIIVFLRDYEIEFSKNSSCVHVRNWLWLAWLEDMLNILKVFLQHLFCFSSLFFWFSLLVQGSELGVNFLVGRCLDSLSLPMA